MAALHQIGREGEHRDLGSLAPQQLGRTEADRSDTDHRRAASVSVTAPRTRATAAAAVVLEPSKSSMIDGLKGAKNSFCAASNTACAVADLGPSHPERGAGQAVGPGQARPPPGLRRPGSRR